MSGKIEISRELADDLTRKLVTQGDFEGRVAAREKLREILATPAVERQPVASPTRKYVWATGLGAHVWRDKLETEKPSEDSEIKDLTPLYAEQPAPVALVLPERLTPVELEELEVIEVLLHGQGLSNLAGTMASARQFIDEVACLDKVKELNQ